MLRQRDSTRVASPLLSSYLIVAVGDSRRLHRKQLVLGSRMNLQSQNISFLGSVSGRPRDGSSERPRNATSGAFFGTRFKVEQDNIDTHAELAQSHEGFIFGRNPNSRTTNSANSARSISSQHRLLSQAHVPDIAYESLPHSPEPAAHLAPLRPFAHPRSHQTQGRAPFLSRKESPTIRPRTSVLSPALSNGVSGRSSGSFMDPIYMDNDTDAPGAGPSQLYGKYESGTEGCFRRKPSDHWQHLLRTTRLRSCSW